MKTTEAKRTQGEWVNENGNISGKWETGESVGICLVGVTSWTGKDYHKQARMKRENEANARFIVTACNSHDALVEALEFILADRNTELCGETCEIIKSALALAEGGE